MQEQDRENLRKIAAEQRDFVDAMKVLRKNGAFRLYLGALEKMIQARGDVLMVPVAGFDKTLEQEFIKGAMNGLILARDICDVTISAMIDVLDEEDEDAA